MVPLPATAARYIRPLFMAGVLLSPFLAVVMANAGAPRPASESTWQPAYVARTLAPPERVFVAGEDGAHLWSQTVGRVAAEALLTRVRNPDFSRNPPGEGIIETSWVGVPSPAAPPNARRRAVVHFLPISGGAWLDTETETALEVTAPRPLSLPSATDRSPLFRSAVAPAHPVNMPFADGLVVPVQYAVSPLPDVRASPPAADGIVTMPPAMPDTWAPLSMPPDSALFRGVRKVGSDYGNFYSCDNLVCVTAAFGAGALMANTGFDTTMQTAWQTSVAPTGFGQFLGGTKPLGEGRYEIPVWGAAAVTGLIFDEVPIGNVVGEWGSRSLRMFVVGAPPLYVMQKVTGASRPSDGHGSQWHFLADNNGVSGHAFIGAVPFLAAADMVENPWAKGVFYVCSTFCGFSRMDANAHYPSQIFLGWYLAFASSMAVEKTEVKFARMSLRAIPMALNNGTGMALEGRW